MNTARFVGGAIIAVAALALASCSAGGDGPADGGSDESGGTEPTSIVVGTLPIVDTAPLHLGIEQGFFEEENLDVTTEIASGGAALLPAVVSGDYQFGFSEMTSLLIASSKGLPVQIVSEGDSSNGNTTLGEDYMEVLVAPGSDIQDVKDLEGKRVATNGISNINYVLVRDGVDAAGGDSEKVEFIEVAFPDQVNALMTGQVDAIATPEPFHTMAINQGAIPIFQTYSAVPNLTVASWFTSSQYEKSNPDVVAAFQRAIQKSLDYATENPEEARRILLDYTQLSPELVEQIVLPGWPATLNRASLEYVMEATDRYGLIEGDVDLDALLGSTPID
ncbi:ABC transporter substrate-binding protein [Microbacterium pseudoresistens]|uniref:NitT/TauT family transport system substrate-binding protein n=1 Tax=Microbacterium pseudoresistens TaxID=640634 RepID=A0A7Y9EVU3_9MICO|nr:ABC transporter substrate-binding protein [Microbacterium pseudoresistens]NYD54902.1 NitT/TauT family transport system substrate-binding protein [Microbacterium pseudoresistens]